MKKLTILGIIVCVGFLLIPVAAMSAPAGPPGGLDVKIINQPVEVTDTNAALCTREPLDFASEYNYTDPVPIIFEVPEGYLLVVESASIHAEIVDDNLSILNVSLGIDHGNFVSPLFYFPLVRSTLSDRVVADAAIYPRLVIPGGHRLMTGLSYAIQSPLLDAPGRHVILGHGYLVSEDCLQP